MKRLLIALLMLAASAHAQQNPTTGRVYTTPGATGQEQVNSSGLFAAAVEPIIASVQAGANAGAKIATAIASAQCPSTGCTIMADMAGGTIATDIFTAITKPVHIIFAPGTFAFTLDTTIPANFTLELQSGAIFAPATTKTLMVKASVIAGNLQKIVAGAGTVTLLNVPEIFVGWYGALCDGTTDDTTAIAALYATLIHSVNATIRWPGGGLACKISNTITLEDAASAVTVEGGTVLWAGMAANPVFSFINNRNVVVEGFSINPDNPATTPIGTAFDIRENTVGGEGISAQNIFRNNFINGVSGTGLGICFEQVQGTAGNANNDQMRFEDNYCTNVTTACWKIGHTQAKNDYFSGNQCNGPVNGVDDSIGASFSWFGGGIYNATNSNYLTGAQEVNIVGVESEGSNHHVIAYPAGANSSAESLNLIANRFSTSALNADGHCVINNSPGALNVIGGSYGEGNGACNFYFNGAAGTQHTVFGSIIGVTSSGEPSDTTPLLAFSTDTTLVNVMVCGNVYEDAGGHAISPALPDKCGNTNTNLTTQRAVLTGAQGSAPAQNRTVLYSWYADQSLSFSSTAFIYLTTADNTGNLYDFGLYGPNCKSGATSVPLIMHTGAIAGSSLRSSPGQTSVGWTSQPTLAPITAGGWYCWALTSSAAAPTLVLGGTALGGNPTYFSPGDPPTGTTGNTTGGVLNSTITAPASNQFADTLIWVWVF